MKLKRKLSDDDDETVPTKQLAEPSIDLTSALTVPSSAIRKRSYIPIEPKNSITKDSNVWFKVERSSEAFTDLRNFEITVVVSIGRKDGRPMTSEDTMKEIKDPKDKKKKIKVLDKKADEDSVTVCQALIYALFSKCSVAINDQPVGPTTQHFPHVSELAMALSTNYETKASFLDATVIWSKFGYDVNDAIQMRKRQVKGSRHFTLTGRLYHSLFNCKRLLPPNTSISINLERSADRLPLIAVANHDDYKIDLHKCTLTVPRVYLTEAKHNEVLSDIRRDDGVFEFVDTYVNPHQVAQGASICHFNDINFGRVPSRAILVFVDSENLVGGSIAKGPFVYYPQLLESLNVRVDDEALYHQPLKVCAPYPDMYRFQPFYVELFKSMEADDKRSTFSLQYNSFVSDRAFFVIDFARHRPEAVGKLANISIEVTFSMPLIAPLGCMIFSESKSGFTLDPSNNVTPFHIK